MALGQVDRKLGLPEVAARCIADSRSPLLIKHAVRDMLRQRVYGLCFPKESVRKIVCVENGYLLGLVLQILVASLFHAR